MSFCRAVAFINVRLQNKLISSSDRSSLRLSGDEDGEDADEEGDDEESSEEVSGDTEDTSPPIKAGGSQDLSEIRQKVKALMR